MGNRAGTRTPEPGESKRGLEFRRQMKTLAGHLYKKQQAAKQTSTEQAHASVPPDPASPKPAS
jgi:hypothetical protein